MLVNNPFKDKWEKIKSSDKFQEILSDSKTRTLNKGLSDLYTILENKNEDFNNEDVIATSGGTRHFVFSNATGKGYGYLIEMNLLSEQDSLWEMPSKDQAQQVAENFLDEVNATPDPVTSYFDIKNVYVYDEATGTYSICTKHAHHYAQFD